MKKVVILGSTGSIGRQALDVIEKSGEEFEVVALSAGSNIDLLEKQIEKFKPKAISVFDEKKANLLKRKLSKRIKIYTGLEGNLKLVELEADIVVAAIVGTQGVYPVLKALEEGKRVALANKESLVVAGKFVKEAEKKGGGEIIPVDSEHSAIFQALKTGPISKIKKIILTASGGPFRKRKDLSDVTVEDALQHPTWNMGKKITIDSASLFNKGLEVIEAKWLFDLDPDKIEVVIHPQSIVHSMVEYSDGSIIAQLGPPDMRIPISYALYYPDRWENINNDFSLVGKKLEFEKPNYEKFPALKLAYRALSEGDLSCFIYSQSNEIAVEAFLKGRIRFLDIPHIVETVMDMKDYFPQLTYNGIMKIEGMIRKKTLEVIESLEKKV